jgi:hypothetical protein
VLLVRTSTRTLELWSSSVKSDLSRAPNVRIEYNVAS